MKLRPRSPFLSTGAPARRIAVPRTFLAAAAAAGLWLACADGPGASAWAQTPSASRNAPSVQRGEPVTLNFENAEIESVARAMATITGQNVVVDPRVRGTINLVTERPVSAQAAFSQFLVALRMQGFTVVEAAGLYKVVPEAEGKLQSGAVGVSEGAFPAKAPKGGQIVTQIFKLNFENANNLVPTLRPLISPNNTITVNPGTNSLVITDYADNLQRLAKIIAALDVSEASDIEIIHLKHAIASDIVPLLNRLLADASPAGNVVIPTVGNAPVAPPPTGGSGQGFRTALLADVRSNAIILRAANPARVAQVRRLVEQLDQPPPPGSSAEHGNIHVVFLKNADAVQLAQTLRAAISAGRIGMGSGADGAGAAATNSNTSGLGVANGAASASTFAGGNASSAGLSSSAALGEGGSANLGAAQAVSTGGIIQADPNTNSLIITAPDPLYRQLRAVIDKLDGRRAQVLVESLVVEVNADRAAEFGIQWQAGIGGSGSSNVGIIGTNYSSGSGSGTNIIDLALASALGYATNAGNTISNAATVANAINAARPGTGINLGVAHNYGGTYVLGLLARFLEGTGDGNVLSTPNLLTLDNQEARIVIGQNVPFVTGQYTANNSNSGSVNPFATIERQDVGISLRVRPQINENGTVKLAVVQEVSDVLASTLNNANGPTTSKRLIETNILVEDGGVVVLGGLLQDSYAHAKEKVPLLGDIPLIGNAFRSETRKRTKTNLMVFLRPVVIRDAHGSDALAQERYDMMRNAQWGVQPSFHPMMRGIQGAPQLPELPPMQEPEPGADGKKEKPASRTVPSLSVLSSEPTQPPKPTTVDVRKLRTGEDFGWADD